jgi:hypothetical protein
LRKSNAGEQAHWRRFACGAATQAEKSPYHGTQKKSPSFFEKGSVESTQPFLSCFVRSSHLGSQRPLMQLSEGAGAQLSRFPSVPMG